MKLKYSRRIYIRTNQNIRISTTMNQNTIVSLVKCQSIVISIAISIAKLSKHCNKSCKISKYYNCKISKHCNTYCNILNYRNKYCKTPKYCNTIGPAPDIPTWFGIIIWINICCS